MGFVLRTAILAVAIFGMLLGGARIGYAADTEDATTVHVKYSADDTELDHFTNGTKFCIDKPDQLMKVPSSMRRMMFTRRASDKPSGLTLDAPKGVKVFLVVESGDAMVDSRKVITDAGWKKTADFLTNRGTTFEVYAAGSVDAVHLSIPASGPRSVVVVAAKLELEPADSTDKAAVPAVLPGGPNRSGAAVPEKASPKPVGPTGPLVIPLGGQLDQIHTGGGGHFLVFHLHDSNQLTVVDVLAGKVVKKIPAEGDICYCMDRDKLVLVLNNQQVIQRWDLATLTREKTVMLPDDRPVKRAIMGSSGVGPLLLWTDGGCRLFDVGTLRQLTVNGTVQNAVGCGPWISPDGMTICDWGWTGGPYSLTRLSNLTAASVDSRVIGASDEGYNQAWAMPSADGTQLVRHGACIFDASTDNLVELAAGPLKDSTVLPTEDPRFLLAVRGEDEGNHTSSVAIVSAFDRRVMYTLRKAAPVTGGMIGTESGRVCSEPRVHYLSADNKLVLIPNSNDKVVVYSFDLEAALKATGADYLYVISKPHTVLTVDQRMDYQIETLSSSGGVKFKLEEGPDGLAISDTGRVTWKASAPADGAKVPVVITLSDSSGQEITHAMELHILPKPAATPDAPAPHGEAVHADNQTKPPAKAAAPNGGIAHADTPPKPPAAAPAKPAVPATPSAPSATKPPEKIPDDPELKALGEKLANKFKEDLNADNAGNNEYSSIFIVSVSKAQRSSAEAGKPDTGKPDTGKPDTGKMVLVVHEERSFLQGGDFNSIISHVDIELKKVDGVWTCTTAKSALDMVSDSHGPLDVPFPPKTHDMTRSMRGLLEDVQPPDEPKKDEKPKADAPPSRRA